MNRLTPALLAVALLLATAAMAVDVSSTGDVQPESVVLQPLGTHSQEAVPTNNPLLYPFSNSTSSSELDEGPVLIFQDNNPWGTTSNQDILDLMGETYTIAGSNQMATINMNNYGVVIVASQQDDNFYTIYNANIGRFEDYVEQGGILEFHGAHYSNVNVVWNLPGGVTWEWVGDNNNYIVDASHPIVQGTADPLTGNYASHGHFLTYPHRSNVITKDSDQYPTTIEYALGHGRICLLYTSDAADE